MGWNLSGYNTKAFTLLSAHITSKDGPTMASLLWESPTGAREEDNRSRGCGKGGRVWERNPTEGTGGCPLITQLIDTMTTHSPLPWWSQLRAGLLLLTIHKHPGPWACEQISEHARKNYSSISDPDISLWVACPRAETLHGAVHQKAKQHEVAELVQAVARDMLPCSSTTIQQCLLSLTPVRLVGGIAAARCFGYRKHDVSSIQLKASSEVVYNS